MDSIIFSVDDRKEVFNRIKRTYAKWARFENSLVFGELDVTKFSDGELDAKYKTSVRDKRVYILSTPSDSDAIMGLNLSIDAAKRAGAKEVIILLTYFAYGRSDRKGASRGAIGGKVFAEMLENRGADMVVTLDLHADQIQGFFKIPVVQLDGRNLFAPILENIIKDQEKFVLVAPDAGATKRVKKYRDLLRELYDIDLPFVIIDKTRPRANEVEGMVLIGEVDGKEAIIIDDIIDTGGTLVKGVNLLLDNGATGVSGMITHGVLSGPAFDRLVESKIKTLITTDSLPTIASMNKIQRVTCANIFAKAIYGYENGHSFSYLMNDYTNDSTKLFK